MSGIQMSGIYILPVLQISAICNCRQLEMVEQEFLAIPVGEEIVYEFMMYSLGVPLSKKYMPTLFSILNERLVRIFKMHPEFEELPIRSQLKVCGTI